MTMKEDEGVSKCITMEELARHNKAGDLWVAIHGDVYDVSGWVADHPGGQFPLRTFAGQDVTDPFLAYHPPAARTLLGSSRVPRVGRLTGYAVSDVSRDYRRLFAEFNKKGLFEHEGNARTLFAILMLVVAEVFTVYRIVTAAGIGARLAWGTLLGFIWVHLGFQAHHTVHNKLTGSSKLNLAINFIIMHCTTGISLGWWKRDHNGHHVACNSLEYDPDVQLLPFLAVSSHLFDNLFSPFYKRPMTFNAVARVLVSYQHWLYYPFMWMGGRPTLVIGSAIYVLRPGRRVVHFRLELVGIVIFWAWYTWVISQLPGGVGERAVFVLMTFLATGLQTVQFTLNHFSARTYVGQPRGDRWVADQANGSLDIKCSPWMDWFHGGLQYQVEHHLFPRLPRRHLRRVAPAIEEFCKKHDLPYTYCSFWEANVRTIGTLKAAAMEARRVIAKGGKVPRSMLWEALTNIG